MPSDVLLKVNRSPELLQPDKSTSTKLLLTRLLFNGFLNCCNPKLSVNRTYLVF